MAFFIGVFSLIGKLFSVGNKSSFTVTGLENGKIYYFAIAAYSAQDESVIGEKSKEVFARPLARLK